MSDFIIRTGDLLQVTISPLPIPTVVPELEVPVPLVGSGTDVLVDARPVCLPGDELPAALKGLLAYTAPPFIIPGTGELTLEKPNVTALTLSDGKPILIKGLFIPTFNVVTPAFAADAPDPDLVKEGIAEFITTNTIVTAS